MTLFPGCHTLNKYIYTNIAEEEKEADIALNIWQH